MKKLIKEKISIMIVSVFFVAMNFVFLPYSYATQMMREVEIIDVIGSAEVYLYEGGSLPAEVGMILSEGDMIETKTDSWLLLKLDGLDVSMVEMEENTTMLLSELIIDRENSVQKTMLDVAIGRILISAEKIQDEHSNFRVKTPTSVVGVRGTTFAVEVEGIE